MSNIPNVLFHVTPKCNVPSILTCGLIIHNRRGLSRYKSKSKLIWLTDNPDFILSTQAGEDWCKLNTPIILRVDITGLSVIQHMINCYDVPTKSKHEFTYDSDISPNRIKVA